MEEKCMNFFGTLFQEDEDRPERVAICFSSKVNEGENRELMRTPTIEEVKSAVDNLHTNKSPGPDGFNGAFFRNF